MLFDEIWEHIGEFGIYQIVIYLVLGLTGLLNGWQNNLIIFVGANLDHWCHETALSHLPFGLQREIVAPSDEQERQTYSQCFRYNLNYSSFTTDELLHWNRTERVNDSTPIVRCESWVYDQSVFVSTLRTKWDLVCQKDYLVQLVQTCYMAGFLIGCIMFGQLSDIIGRLKTLVASVVIQALFTLGSAYAPVFWLYCVCRTMVGIGIAGGFTIYTVLIMELIGRRYRVVTCIMAHFLFSVGQLTLSGFTWAIRDMSKCELLIAVLTSVLVFCILLGSESPRWLVSVGRDEEAKQVLAKIALVNGTELPTELGLEDNRDTDKALRKASIADLMRGRHIRAVTLYMWGCWFVTGTVTFGLTLSISFLSGSLFTNNAIGALIQVPSLIITAFVMERFGRRWSLIFSFLIAGLFCLGSIPLVGRTEYNWLFTTFVMLGQVGCNIAFTLIYVYAAELFPTGLRNVGVGTSSTLARIGGLLQPQMALTEKIWRPLPFLLYGILALVGCFLPYFLPETKGRDLPETVEDMKRPRKQQTRMSPGGGKLTTVLPDIGSWSNTNKAFEIDHIQDPKDTKESEEFQRTYI